MDLSELKRLVASLEDNADAADDVVADLAGRVDEAIAASARSPVTSGLDAAEKIDVALYVSEHGLTAPENLRQLLKNIREFLSEVS